MKRRNYTHIRARNTNVFLAFALVCIISGIAAIAHAKEPAPNPFPGVSLSVENSTIPPGGIFQFQLMLTEPKPIGSSSTRPSTPRGAIGAVRGIALNDKLGVTAGVAVVSSSGIQITTTSPLATFGTDPSLDYPILTLTFPVLSDAVVGSQLPLTVYLGSSLFTDAAGNTYPQEVRPGRLTIGGTLSISDILPGGGMQPAGTHVLVIGTGFTSESQVTIEGLPLSSRDFSLVSPTEMSVTLPAPFRLDGARFRVRNKGGAVVQYFSYARAQAVGVSINPLVSECYPLFSTQTYTAASLNWSRSATTFTALALQNTGNVEEEATVEMLSASGQVLGSISIPLPSRGKITRDLAELFPQGANTATSVRITSAQPIQILGLLGDTPSGNVVPVVVNAL